MPPLVTIWRVLSGTDRSAFDRVVGVRSGSRFWGENVPGTGEVIAELVHLRLDGKTVRGAGDAQAHQPHLIALLAGPPGRTVELAQQGSRRGETPGDDHRPRPALGA